jgi:hypothetical protein
MSTQPQPLSVAQSADFATVVLDGSGNGTASLGPTRVREHWQLSAASVFVNQNPTNQAQCQLYVGSTPTIQNFTSQTVTGSSGDTCGLGGIDIQSGMKVWAKWTGGDAGQTAIVTLIGTFTIGAP